MELKILGKKDPDIAIVWNGTNLDDIQKLLGESYQIQPDEATKIIITKENVSQEVLIGWYIIVEKYITPLNQLDYRITCASSDVVAKYYDIIE